jgi:hypothetical protein
MAALTVDSPTRRLRVPATSIRRSAIAGTGAPFGDAGTGDDPLVPYDALPQDPVKLGYLNRNHDDGVTSNGGGCAVLMLTDGTAAD